jgi:hypothetical protein
MIGSRRIWSLLDIMNQFHIHGLLEQLQRISMLTLGFTVIRPSGTQMSDKEQTIALEAISDLKGVLKSGDFADSCQKIERSAHWIGAQILDASAVGAELRNIIEFILMETDKQRFLYVARDRVGYLENSNFIGDFIAEAFPNAEADAREAGNCLAAECNTAAVFHLMRVVEWGLRALCVDLGMKQVKSKIKKSGRIVYTPIEYSEWERLLDGLQERVDTKLKALKRGSRKQELQQFYYPVLQDLRGIRDAWRNHVMHARDEYTREDATAILGHVKRLMGTLATRISEV